MNLIFYELKKLKKYEFKFLQAEKYRLLKTRFEGFSLFHKIRDSGS